MISPTAKKPKNITLSLKKRNINKSQLCETGMFSRLDETQNFTQENTQNQEA